MRKAAIFPLAFFKKISYDDRGHTTDGSREICVGVPTGSMSIWKEPTVWATLFSVPGRFFVRAVTKRVYLNKTKIVVRRTKHAEAVISEGTE